MTTTPDVESAPPAELGRRARRDQKTAKRPKPVTEKAAGVPLTERVAGVASGIGTRWREWVSLFEPVLEPVRRVLVCVSTLGWLTLAAALGCWLLAAAFGWREFAWHTLFHFPDLATQNLRSAFDAFPWPRLRPTRWNRC